MVLLVMVATITLNHQRLTSVTRLASRYTSHSNYYCPIIVLTSTLHSQVVVPSGPTEAKGLLLASIRDPNPVLYFEPKVMYRSAVQEVPVEDYEIPLGKARIVREVRGFRQFDSSHHGREFRLIAFFLCDLHHV